MKKAYCGAAVVLCVALAWWAMSGKHNPCWYVLMVCLLAMLGWLAGVFIWHWTRQAVRMIVLQVLCLAGVAHRAPGVHMPEWEEKPIRVRRWGPIRDHWWSQGYYASIEYCVCRHKGCRAFRIIRIFKDV